MISTRDTTCAARSNIYNFLAQVFDSHPTQDSIHGLREMALALEMPCPDGFSLPELDREYTELFIVPNSRYVAPYESVFRDHWEMPATLKRGSNPGEASVMIKGLVMGDSTLAVRHCYLEAGVLPSNDLPDHIANELRFMAHLWNCEIERTGKDAARLVKLRVEFCRQHLLKWIGQLRDKVAESRHRGYYFAALQIAEVVLRDDAN